MPSGDRTIESPAAAPAPVLEPAAPPAAVPQSPAVAAPATEPTEARPEAPVTEPPAGEPPAETPAAESPAVAEPPAEAEKPKLHTDTPTLMERAGEEQPKPEGEGPAAEPIAPRTYEPFALPEGLSLDQTKVTEAAASLFAADNLPQERAQAYVDFHIAEMQRFQEAELQAQHDAFAKLRADWVTQVMADPEIGGNGHQTAMRTIAMMRDLFVSSAPATSERYQQEMQEFNEFLRITGAGDHPAFNRFLHNVGRKFQEPAAPSITFKPPPDIGHRPNGAGSRRQALYSTVDTTSR